MYYIFFPCCNNYFVIFPDFFTFFNYRGGQNLIRPLAPPPVTTVHMQVETPLPSPSKIQVALPINSKKVNGVNPSTSKNEPKSEEKNGEDGELTNGE